MEKLCHISYLGSFIGRHEMIMKQLVKEIEH